MSWTDKELDELFKDAAAGQSFEYKAAYFKDIEAQLPVNKSHKRGIFWWLGGSTLFLLLIGTVLFLEPTNTDKSSNTLQTKTENIFRSATGSIKVRVAEKRSSKNHSLSVSSTVNDRIVVTASNRVTTAKQSDIVKSAFVEPISGDLEVAIVSEHTLNGVDVSNEIGQLSTQINGIHSYATPELIQQNFSLPILSRSKSQIYFEFSGGMGQSPIRSTENGSARSMNWSVSSGYQFAKNNWAVSAGAGVGEQHFNNLFIKERSTIYGFGVNTFDNHYQFSSLFTLDLPVNFSYRFGAHELSAGLTTSMPLFARVSYTELKDGKENESGRAISSASPFFRKVLLAPELGYRFALDQNWSIGASLKTQLLNPIATDRMKGERSVLPLSGQITLRRTITLN